MDTEFIWIFIVCLTFLPPSWTLTSYSDMCDRIITLDRRNLAAKLTVHLDITETNYDCQVTVHSEPEFQIAYLFYNPGSFDALKECEFSVSFDDHITPHYNVCFDNETIQTIIGRVASGNKLTVHIQGDLSKVPSFQIQFISLRKIDNGQRCEGDEFLCNDTIVSEIHPVCLEYSLICHETFVFCETKGDECSVAEQPTSGVQTYTIIIAVVISAVMIGIVMLMICIRQNQLARGNNSSTAQDIRSRAMAIFSTQLASRGVDSADGNDNRAYLDEDGNPIDFSKFDPPPEYGSLEHLDNIGVTDTDNPPDEEDPPHYDQVMQNSDHFNVTTEL